MNFLFWNIRNKDSFFELICEMVKDNSIGVLMFAEFPDGKQNELENLLKRQDSSYHYLKPFKEPAKVEVFTNFFEIPQFLTIDFP